MANGYHFNNSRASTQKDEPVYLTKWVTTFVLPAPLQPTFGASIISEQIKKIGGLDLDKLPGAENEQFYRFHKRRYAGSVVDTTVDLDMTFEVNVDSNLIMYPYNIFKAWSRLIYDPSTGFQTLKKDYTGSLNIDIHNKTGQVLRSVYFPMVFISKPIKGWNLEYNTEQIYEMDLSLAAENPTDLIIGGGGR